MATNVSGLLITVPKNQTGSSRSISRAKITSTSASASDSPRGSSFVRITITMDIEDCAVVDGFDTDNVKSNQVFLSTDATKKIILSGYTKASLKRVSPANPDDLSEIDFTLGVTGGGGKVGGPGFKAKAKKKALKKAAKKKK